MEIWLFLNRASQVRSQPVARHMFFGGQRDRCLGTPTNVGVCFGRPTEDEPGMDQKDEHLLSLIAQGPVVIYTSRPDGDYGATSISDNITAQLGYSPSDFVENASFWADHIHPDDREQTLAGLAALYENDQHEHDYRFLHKDGSYRWMNDRLRLLRDERGTPIEIVGYWVDITGRKEAEQAVRLSEERFELAMSGAEGGMWDKDLRTGIEQWAPRFYELLGYEPGEIEASNAMFMSVLHPDDRAHVEQAVQRHIERRSPNYQVEFRIRTKSGQQRWIRSRARAIWHDDGTPVRLVGFSTDITARKEAEAALRESDLRFNLAVSGANEGLWDRNLVTDNHYWAPRFYTLLGYEVGEIEPSNDTLLELLHPDDVSVAAQAIRAHILHRTPYDVEYRLLTKSDGYRWFRSRARAIWDESGRATRMVGFISDITEERRLRATLRETQQLLDSTPDPTIVVDGDGSIVFANSKASAFGYDNVELRHERIAALLPEFAQLSLASATSQELETFGRRRDGAEFPAEVSVSPIDTDAGRLVAVAIRDSSHRKEVEERERQLEAKLQHAQKLESLGVLAGGIAHDFNNFLTGVLGNAEVALMKLSAESPGRAELQNVIAATLRASDLTQQMLAYAGKGKFVIEPLDLSKLVEEIGHLVDASISKSVDVEYRLADRLPAVDADASQIQQIIMNLIINAAEAIGDRTGVVTVTTSAIDVDGSYLAEAYFDDDLATGRYVCLEVADTGCGMDDATRQRIFDPFFSTKFAGRGLGLAAVLGIIRGHHGTLEVYSEPDAGSVFKVLLPASASSVNEPTTQPQFDQGQRAVGTVLVVDDEEQVRIAARRMLETRDFTVLTAEDGQEALAVFRQQAKEIVVVLLDLTMPRMDGTATFQELRRIDPDVRVILSSGFNEQELTNRFGDHELAGFLQKPYGLGQLIDAVVQAATTRPPGHHREESVNTGVSLPRVHRR